MLLGEEPLPRSFFARPVVEVARDCIGTVLVHRAKDALVAGRIVETEAYRGPEDLAAHSKGGRRTKRTEVMFGRAGHAYVFLIYGLHYHFNIVTGQEGEPHAVLVRAVEPLHGAEAMAARRSVHATSVQMTNGPGKLCQAFAIDASHYGMDLCQDTLFLRAGPPTKAARSLRIGVEYAGSWAKKPWRFYDPKSPYVSRAPRSRVSPG